MAESSDMAEILRRVTAEAGGDSPDLIYIGDSDEYFRLFWRADEVPPSHADRKGEPLLVIWLGKVRMASWNTEVDPANWQEWPDGDFAINDGDVTAWTYPEFLVP